MNDHSNVTDGSQKVGTTQKSVKWMNGSLY